MAVGNRRRQRLRHRKILLHRHLLHPLFLRPHRLRQLRRRTRPAHPPTNIEGKKRKMSSSMAEARGMTAAVVTVSDSCARGEREDLSGPAVAQLLQKLHFTVTAREIVPDDPSQIQNVIIRLAREVQFVVTTGGTGIAARDVTPEATTTVCERILDGMAERMRIEGARKTPFAALSRGVCGVRGRALVLNLPGSPTGAVESLEAVAALVPHAIELLSGKTEQR
jgi:molybdopterin adenylyltransferase